MLLASAPLALTTCDVEGRTPLFVALQHGHNQCASTLLEVEDDVLSCVTKVWREGERGGEEGVRE